MLLIHSPLKCVPYDGKEEEKQRMILYYNLSIRKIVVGAKKGGPKEKRRSE